MDEIIKKIVGGGAAVLLIGGTSFMISQADVANNFAEETGMDQQQAQEYVENAQGELESFEDVGQDYIDDGNEVLANANGLDCVNYMYDWESDSLSCEDGRAQLLDIGAKEVALGECFVSLGGDLGDVVRSKIQECIEKIDAMMATLEYAIVPVLIGTEYLTEMRHSNAYNKSVLRAALDAEN